MGQPPDPQLTKRPNHTDGGSAHQTASDVSATDLAMMERAIALAAQAARRAEVPVGAVVYKGDRIIAEAANNREAAQDPVGHAELLAMSKADLSFRMFMEVRNRAIDAYQEIMRMQI